MLSSGPEQAKAEPSGLQDKVSLKSRNKKQSELRIIYILYRRIWTTQDAGRRSRMLKEINDHQAIETACTMFITFFSCKIKNSTFFPLNRLLFVNISHW